MLNTNTQDLKANTSSKGKSILAVTADTVNPNGGFLIGISQPSNPNAIVFGHDKTAFVIDTLNDACDFAFYGERTHEKLMKRRLEQDIERGVERPDAVLSAVWHKDSDTYTVSAIAGAQTHNNEVTGMSFDRESIGNLVKDLYRTSDSVSDLINDNRQRMGVIAREINEAQKASGLWHEIHMKHDGSYMRFVGVEAGVGCELKISDDGWATIIVTRNSIEFKKSVLLGRQAIHDYIWLLYEEAMGGKTASSYS